MRSKLFSLTAVLLLGLTVLAGCGGDDDDTSASDSSPVAAEVDGDAQANGDGGAGGEPQAGGDTEAGAGAGGDGSDEGSGGGADGGAGSGPTAGSGGGDRGSGGDRGGGRDAGGGGSAQSGAAGGEAQSPVEDFIVQANVICDEGSKKIEDRTQSYLQGTTPKSKEDDVLKEIINQVLAPTFEEEIEGIGALGLPAGDEGQIEAIFAAMRQVIAEAKANPVTFNETLEPFKQPEELAIAYGLGSCGGV